MTNFEKQIETCKKTGEFFSKEIKTVYYGFDHGSNFEARATLEIRADGYWTISIYDYYDPDQEEWINTEERMNWISDDIDREFFEN